MKRRVLFYLSIALPLIVSGCKAESKLVSEENIEAQSDKTINESQSNTVDIKNSNSIDSTSAYPAFTDFLEVNNYMLEPISISSDLFKESDIPTYTFDSIYTFEGSESIAQSVLENAKNPGLGVRALHKKGITGKNIRVGIIDQHLLISHPEYKSNIIAYFDSGCNTRDNEGSYHGAAVTSILCGQSIGVAPEAIVYYAAAPSWEKDSQYFADCLNWMIEENKKLPKDDKIRVVSVSSAPTSQNNWYKNGEAWSKAVEKAKEEGMMVIDCREGEESSFVFTAYLDGNDIDEVKDYKPFYPNNNFSYEGSHWQNYIFAPASKRTLAREYDLGDIGYRYQGVGGQSWSLPYVTGVLALGAQVRPDLSMDELKTLLFETAYKTPNGYYKIVNPVAFIEALENLA